MRCRIQDMMRYYGVRGNLSTSSQLTDIDDRFEVLVDANDQLLERVVRLMPYVTHYCLRLHNSFDRLLPIAFDSYLSDCKFYGIGFGIDLFTYNM